MKFSSIYLIAAALAAIAGSAMAAPGPLRVRDLDDSFERDLGVYRRQSGVVLERDVDGDDLLTRRAATQCQKAHSGVVVALKKAITANHQAADDTHIAAQYAIGSRRENYLNRSGEHTSEAYNLKELLEKHETAAKSSTVTDAYNHVITDLKRARDSAEKAKSAITESQRYYISMGHAARPDRNP